LRLSQAPSIHNQFSQEFRYAGDFNKLSGVVGAFLFYQDLKPDGAHLEEAGIHQWRFSQNNTNPLWQTPGLLEEYGIRSYPLFNNLCTAIFGQIDWKITSRLTVYPGIRFNYDKNRLTLEEKLMEDLIPTTLNCWL
jgi:iron complex outermembrane receptor protein